jgi:hypothetical protein
MERNITSKYVVLFIKFQLDCLQRVCILKLGVTLFGGLRFFEEMSDFLSKYKVRWHHLNFLFCLKSFLFAFIILVLSSYLSLLCKFQAFFLEGQAS